MGQFKKQRIRGGKYKGQPAAPTAVVSDVGAGRSQYSTAFSNLPSDVRVTILSGIIAARKLGKGK